LRSAGLALTVGHFYQHGCAVTARKDNDAVEQCPPSAACAGEPHRATVNLAELIAGIMDPLGGVELDIPPRAPTGPLPTFDGWPDDEEPADG
jgi:hypothetical protein